MPKMYLTKCALSGGIKEIEAVPTYTDGWVRDQDNYLGGSHRVGVDVFASLDEAKADVEKRRIKRLASLKKQIAKLEKLEF